MRLSTPCPCTRHGLHCILPPYILERMAESKVSRVRRLAVRTIEASAEARTMRSAMREMPTLAAFMPATAKKTRHVYDARGQGQHALPGQLVRSEGQPRTGDPAVDEAYDHSGSVHDFYRRVFARRSLDDQGMALVSSVHVGFELSNAFWNGRQMLFGDGDGEAFLRFTRSLDVVGHELTHGVIAHECNLVYRDEPGAVNEHLSDVFGLLARQWKRQETAAQSDWLIGRELLGPQATTAKGLRHFGPGKAFEDDPVLGTDPQPKHMSQKYKGAQDHGGVHLNSGILNHAFYLFAMAVGGPAWEVPGAIWYEAMRRLSSTSDFGDMADTTRMIAAARHGAGSAVHEALLNAWTDVGL
ncbi:MAG: M4 family metallopeptidase [Rhodoferax sp.]|nr:M4 family metallopeptidase [Rhodoferax sp.]